MRRRLYSATAHIICTALCDALETHAQAARMLADAFKSELDAWGELTPNVPAINDDAETPVATNVIYLNTKSRNKIAR